MKIFNILFLVREGNIFNEIQIETNREIMLGVRIEARTMATEGVFGDHAGHAAI